MVSVSEAEFLINQKYFSPKTANSTLEQAVGKILAEEIVADRDLPPFNRATMDGIAIASSSFSEGNRKFRIKGLQPAGVPPLSLDNKEQCIEIMTGAVVPDTADAVVRYEDIRTDSGSAEIIVNEVTTGQNIHRQGTDAPKGSVLLNTSQKISPAEIALLASLGRSTVKVFESPLMTVVSTGDELVPVDATPKPWQIRTSNAYSIIAALKEMGHAAKHHHLVDDEKSITREIGAILDVNDVVILSGGVSKGKFDYVPGALANYGVEKIFHEVSQRPGKPMWFGRGKNKTVFALPGNPVSTFMCFHRYVKPWLQRCMSQVPLHQQWAKLGRDFQFKPALTYFLQVSVRNEQGTLIAAPDAGGGSGDFANLRNVDGFLELPLDKSEFRAGEVFPYFPFRS
jgi:molybdopterin molybdotransferase